MKRCYLLISLIFFLILPDYVFAKPVKINVFPEKIFPGDAFLIKVKNLKSKDIPVAYVNKKEFVFVESSKDSYIAIGAFDINAKSRKYKIKIKSGKKIFTKNIYVRKKKFSAIKLSLPDEKVFPDEDDLNRIELEKTKLKEIWQTITEKKWEGNFISPLENEPSTLFGVKRIMNEKWISIHRGVDLKGQEGELIKASNNGKVVLTEDLFYGGNTIVIDHGLGIYSLYMHLSSMMVKDGDYVEKGQIIGKLGSTGRATGPHLHFGIKINSIDVNPISLIQKINLK